MYSITSWWYQKDYLIFLSEAWRWHAAGHLAPQDGDLPQVTPVMDEIGDSSQLIT